MLCRRVSAIGQLHGSVVLFDSFGEFTPKEKQIPLAVAGGSLALRAVRLYRKRFVFSAWQRPRHTDSVGQNLADELRCTIGLR